jgi:uncharacterized protein (DUF2141 family)
MKHRWILAALATAASLAASLAAAAGATAEFLVLGANSNQGTMRAMLCTEAERFPNGCKLALSAPARVDGTSLVFNDLAPGRYALSVLDDEDDSGRLGISRVSGKPKGIGFSNNVTGPGGVPTFNLAAVDVKPAGIKQTVRLRGFAFGH